jgi:hypothetical protein
MGESIRQRTDEEAFVIEPIMTMRSVEDVMNQTIANRFKNELTYIPHHPVVKEKAEAEMTERDQLKQQTIHLDETLDDSPISPADLEYA